MKPAIAKSEEKYKRPIQKGERSDGEFDKYVEA